MSISRREYLTAGLALPLLAVTGTASAAEQAAGSLDDDALENMLKAMGLQTEKIERRFDFGFKAVYADEEWVLSMSTVLSVDETSIWVMAWLDELPRSAADVPRTALLRLLAENDRLGSGKFFAYIASNRRFVLQRAVDNQGLDTRKFRAILEDLGSSVVATHPYWSVSNWSQGTPTQDQAATQTGSAVPRQRSTPTTRTVINESNYSGRVRQ